MPLPDAASPSQLAMSPNTLAALRRDAQRLEPSAVHQAARQFEALFLREVLRNVRASALAQDVLGSDQLDTYQEMFDAQLADSMTRGGGVGLASLLEKQLSGQAAQSAPAAPAMTPLSTATVAPAMGRMPAVAVACNASAAEVQRRSARTGTSGNVAQAGTAVTADTKGDFLPGSAEEFVQQLLPHAQWAARQLGIAPAAIVAQAALESAWGRRMPRQADGTSSFNLFGIKAGTHWSGARANVSTVEFVDGIAVRGKALFRAYDSIAEGIRDYVEFVKGGERYQTALQAGSDAYGYATALARAGYATDPRYAAKFHAVLDSPLLQGLAP
jgi:flagellar protein FlgJ